ncbi:MAG TPA: site-specific integrase, partial [Rhizomicrobium sp.]
MADDRSRQKLMEFLEYLANKGLMAENTVAARKSAVSKILGILSESEAVDVTQLDLDQVMVRFQNLEGKNYTPGSMNTYLSRLRSAIDDFRTYLQNPLAFKPSVQAREKRAKPEAQKEGPVPSEVIHSSVTPSKSPVMPSDSILPIRIRQDTTVYIQGIPYDLTDAEATKIA